MKGVHQNDINHIAGQVASQSVERLGNSLNETVAGNHRLIEVAKQYMNCDDSITQGRLFEIIETRKFNVNAAKAGELLRAVTTEQLGMPHHEADVLIKNPTGDVLREIQAKSGSKASHLANYIRDEKYKGMDRLVNVEHEKRVEELMNTRIEKGGIFTEQYKDAQANLKGQLEYGGISSGGTTYEEALEAAKNPEKYVLKSNAQELFSGISNAMISGALAGAFVGGAVNMTTGIFKGEFSVKETGKAALNSATRGGVIGGIAYGFKYLGRNTQIMTGNVAAALASSAVNMTESTYKFLTGQITTEEYVEQLGKNAVSCFSGIVMTAAGGMLFGPIGAAVAGTVSLIGMRQLYNVFTSARENLELAREARLKAEALSALLIEKVKEEERALIAYYKEYEETFKNIRHFVNLAIADDTFTEQAIVSLAEGLNVQFQFDTLEKFSDFMLSDDTLEL
ncbi:hypothetical protein [Fervidibacillus halotolerans]|uniref:Uncharacterized protein n=1 Tax=Fervidibacillus halotolerans TaxID=2980027 RepID=A0A9E8RY87_9BACI|nr:hypothetical protein [Fervidibacillus halotolerans]WAA11973.1 hypothetical protein OE105_10335 [Fervidibacillus halotolerans]